MNTRHPQQTIEEEPMVLSVSLWVRIAIRVFITVALVLAVFGFLFYSPITRFVTYPIPAAVLLFALLSGLERGVRRYVRRKHGMDDASEAVARYGSGFTLGSALAKISAALLLSAVLIASTLYDFPPLGIAAAMILLVATVVESPQLGFFTTSLEIDKKARLRRQTLDSLSDVFPDDRFERKQPGRADSEDVADEDPEPPVQGHVGNLGIQNLPNTSGSVPHENH